MLPDQQVDDTIKRNRPYVHQTDDDVMCNITIT